MKVVFPEAEQSTTKPGRRLFSEVLTGIRNLPPRMQTCASSSVMPSALALDRTAFAFPDRVVSLWRSSLRILSSSGEAVSRIYP